MKTIVDSPWRACHELRRLLSLPLIRLQFALQSIDWGKGWRIWGCPILQCHRGSQIVIGDYADLRSWPGTNPLTPNHPVVLATRCSGARIQIGHHCGFTGTTLVAAESIEIGNWVVVGANCTIVDTDFHPLAAAERRLHVLDGTHKPIMIEDEVFVGMNSLILKGVTLGRGCVIGAGSVVTRDVPPGMIAAGNPARVIGPVSTK